VNLPKWGFYAFIPSPEYSAILDGKQYHCDGSSCSCFPAVVLPAWSRSLQQRFGQTAHSSYGDSHRSVGPDSCLERRTNGIDQLQLAAAAYAAHGKPDSDPSDAGAEAAKTFKQHHRGE
jgi:hypothetical protein